MAPGSPMEDRRRPPAAPGRLRLPELPVAGIKEIVDTLRRRRRLILAGAATGAIAATIAGLGVTPYYTAQALVLVALNSQQRSEEGTVETHIRLIESRD